MEIIGAALFYSGLDIMNLKAESNNFVKIKSVPEIQNDRVYSLYEDNTGILWIGTYAHGVYEYDKNYNHFQHYLKDPVRREDVFSILEDNDGELWIGTLTDGLIRINRDKNTTLSYLHDARSSNCISSNSVMALCQTTDGFIWIGTLNGGLNRFDKVTGKFTHYTVNGGNGGGNLSSNDITSLFEDSKKNLWIGNGGGGIDCFNKKTNSFMHYKLIENNPNILGEQSVTVFREDKNGSIWIGTLRGMYEYIPSKKSCVWYKNIPEDLQKKKTEASIKAIQSIYFDDKGNMWIGTSRSGLISYNFNTNQADYYTTQDGLPDNVIYGILPDENGTLWLSTNNGISNFNPTTRRAKNFDANNGLQSNEFNTGAYCRNLKGEMFFGGINGFNIISPADIEQNKHIPPVYITSFKVFDNTLPLSDPVNDLDTVKLSYFQNFFSFEFVALNYVDPEKNQYAFMLEGFDKNWHMVNANRRYAGYSNLNPGTYILQIKASNNDGIWNINGTKLIIIITPPFWMEWWFATILILIIVAILYIIYKYRVNRLLAVERTRIRISQDLHDEVSASITGIVYFLRAIISNIGDSMTPKIQKLLSLINENAINVQESISDIIWSTNPENDKWDIILPRLRHYASNICESKGIEYSINIPSVLTSPSSEMEMRHDFWLIFKEVVLNSIKHSGCKRIEINLTENHKNLLLHISDNGKGFECNKVKEGNGIKNIYSRVDKLKGNLTLITKPGEGTCWEITIPI